MTQLEVLAQLKKAVQKMTDEHSRAVRRLEEAEFTTQSDQDEVEAMHWAVKKLTRMATQAEEKHTRLMAIVVGLEASTSEG